MSIDNSDIGLPSLKNLLLNLMIENVSGIFTCNGSSVALSSKNGSFIMFDSHSRGSNGKIDPNGSACLISTLEIDTVLDTLQSNIPKSRDGNDLDGQFQFTKLSVIMEEKLVPDSLQNYFTEIESCEVSSKGNDKVDYETHNTMEIDSQLLIEDLSLIKKKKHSNDIMHERENCKKEETVLDMETNSQILHDSMVNSPTSMQRLEDGISCLDNEMEKEKENYEENIEHSSLILKDTEEVEDTELICRTEPLNEGVQNLPMSDENIFSNFGWIWNQLHKEYDRHDNFNSCNFENIKFIGVTSLGLIKVLHFKCELCGKTAKIKNVPDSENNLDLNVAAAVGCQTVGIGHSQFEEMIGCFGVRCMSYGLWQKSHDACATGIKKAARLEMLKAAEEERQEAIKRKNIINGIPFITVEGDGSYMKRSYKNSKMNSPAACVVIIGAYTKKVLQIIIKQKTCAVCDVALIKGQTPKAHDCYRNHGSNESSTSMESAAFAEAFSKSIPELNLIYKTLITDGDSSNYKAILDSNPYATEGVEVQNILCVNHIKRNVSTAIKQLSRTKRRLGSLKNKIELSAPKFIDAITDCVNNISQLECSWGQKCKTLCSNINALPYHIFGDHSQCENNYYECNTNQKENDPNLVPALQNSNVFHDIEQCVYRAVNNASSLLHNHTTNRSESFNALIAKTIGAKRINFAKKESYASRCNVAVLACNAKQTIAPVCKALGKNTVSIGENVQNKRSELNALRNLRQENNVKDCIKKKASFQKGDMDYGLNATQVDANKEEMKNRIKAHYQILEKWRIDRDNIEARTVDQSNSSEWRMKRKWLITASKMGKICRKREETSCRSFVEDILYPSIKTDNPALNYGTAMETVAKKMLEDVGYTNIRPCGLFIDDECLGIGASPDGLIDDDGIIEIKCPYTARHMDADDAIKNKQIAISRAFKIVNGEVLINHQHHYYYQIQGQLRVTKRKYCLFVICTEVSLKIIRVERNEPFIFDMMFKLGDFYRKCLVPEIVDSRKKRKMPTRETYDLEEELLN